MQLFREVAIETPCIGVYQGTPCRCSDRGYYKTRQDKTIIGPSLLWFSAFSAVLAGMGRTLC